jgi:HEAT repeat protein
MGQTAVCLGDLTREPLTRILSQDSDQFVRAMAATSLGQLGDARAVDALTAALTDDSSLVRDNARQALTAIRRR